ncbi:hypothetical protein CNR27_08740 [Luteimonas chenhongjianii]|uniref:Uncharacterized protein n=1 Tax=Luteimonas chenhongjianii TaxID=2006110 RepID=A0A290XEF4_9GAMM|nr:hypothetical protein [Luteimonas chenhongjianii]ATD67510.1 hypothetical protein CNR27_08740 [Luteimonas chenhongjianii]
MSEIRLFSEPFAKTGNMAAEGFRRLLGRPALGLLQTVIRESIQNVLDAAHDESGARVLVRLRTLDPRQRSVLAGTLLADRPRGDATRADIEDALTRTELRVLEICDFGTDGLSGPTRADAPHDGKEPLNFVNFLRNVGAARDTHHGGGTYGYGKSSLYAMSRCSTIIVDSQTRYSGSDVRRLMACHLGAAFDAMDEAGCMRRFTGRHWWGVLDGSDSVEPVTGAEATSISAALGMPERHASKSGTSVLIVDPLLAGEDPRLSAEDIVETVLWNFWPRMLETTPHKRRLKVEVELDGETLPVPRPEDFPPLDLFAAAMSSHRNRSENLEEVRSLRPKRLLGKFSRQQGLRAERVGPAMRENSLIPKQASHIALMRPVELVVRYIVGDPLPDRRFDWAGVFICSGSDDVEEAFAQAEPPAHDDWVPDNLPKGNAKTFVSVALRELNKIAKPNEPPSPSIATSSASTPSLAATATRLGAMLGGVSASGPGKQHRAASGKNAARKGVRVSAPRFAGLSVRGGRPVAHFVADIENDGSVADLHLIVEPYLVMDGGSTTSEDLPDQYGLKVEQILLADQLVSGWSLKVGRLEGEVQVIVPTAPDAAIGVRLTLQRGAAE